MAPRDRAASGGTIALAGCFSSMSGDDRFYCWPVPVLEATCRNYCQAAIGTTAANCRPGTETEVSMTYRTHTNPSTRLP